MKTTTKQNYAQIYQVNEKYKEYLKDASGMEGSAESISFPQTSEAVGELLISMRQAGKTVTVQGGRTGIVGAAVPQSNHLLNMSRMDQVLEYEKTPEGRYFLEVEPGVTIQNLEKAIKDIKDDPPLFWPPSPTETQATIGGAAACDTKGINAVLYGSARKYIDSIQVVFPSGQEKTFCRGEGSIRFYNGEKDLVDIFLGCEGMLGVITKLRLELIPRPSEEWGLAFYFANPTDALHFGQDVENKQFSIPGASIAVLEYLDHHTITLIEQSGQMAAEPELAPAPPAGTQAMVYIEVHGNDPEDAQQVANHLVSLATEKYHLSGSVWVVSENTKLKNLRQYRYLAYKLCNEKIFKAQQNDPRINKLSTDMSVDGLDIIKLVQHYEEGIGKAKLSACIFGHIPHSHLYVNLLPETYEEYEAGLALIEKWSEQIAEYGGIIATDHGIGKIKRSLYIQYAGRKDLQQWKILKARFDPDGTLNPHNFWLK